jgi:hypothetical protein
MTALYAKQREVTRLLQWTVISQFRSDWYINQVKHSSKFDGLPMQWKIHISGLISVGYNCDRWKVVQKTSYSEKLSVGKFAMPLVVVFFMQ